MDRIPVILRPETPEASDKVIEVFNVFKKLTYYDPYIVPELPEWSNWYEEDIVRMRDRLIQRYIDKRPYSLIIIVSAGGTHLSPTPI